MDIPSSTASTLSTRSTVSTNRVYQKSNPYRFQLLSITQHHFKLCAWESTLQNLSRIFPLGTQSLSFIQSNACVIPIGIERLIPFCQNHILCSSQSIFYPRTFRKIWMSFIANFCPIKSPKRSFGIVCCIISLRSVNNRHSAQCLFRHKTRS